MTDAFLHPKGKTTIRTFSGRDIDLVNPRPEDVDLRDITHGLANISRFGGQAKRWSSVAAHSTLVWKLVCTKTDDPELQMAALLHDAHEAYLGDDIRPKKTAVMYVLDEQGTMFDPIRGLEQLFDRAIAAKFGIDQHLMRDPLVKEMDQFALLYEASKNHNWTWTEDKPRPSLPRGLRWRQFLPPHLAERQFRIAFRYAQLPRDRVALLGTEPQFD
jgi:5'-nucleotidase